MELQLVRNTFTNNSTIGELYVDGVFECYMLEDVDRGLTANMPLATIRRRKVYAQTAIPYGKYEIVINWSNRFKQYMPLLLNVPGYTGVRIHSGNHKNNTEGCPLTGTTKSTDWVGDSRKAYRKLFAKMRAAEKREKIFINIIKGNA